MGICGAVCCDLGDTSQSSGPGSRGRTELMVVPFCARVVLHLSQQMGFVFVQGNQSFGAGSELCSALEWEMRGDKEKLQWQSTDRDMGGCWDSEFQHGHRHSRDCNSGQF